MNGHGSAPTPRTPRGSGPECDFIREQLEAFELGALDRTDHGIVEHHLRWCARCRAESQRYQTVANLLPLAVPDQGPPDPRIRQRLMTRVARPTTEALHVMSPARREVAGSSPRASWHHRIANVLLAPLAIAVLVLGVWATTLKQDLDDRNRDLSQQVELNQAMVSGNQVQLFSLRQNCPTCTGNGQFGISTTSDLGMMVGWNFNPAQQHDVWQVNAAGERKKVCQLQVDQEGSVMQMFQLPEATADYPEVYITDQNGELIYISRLDVEAPGSESST